MFVFVQSSGEFFHDKTLMERGYSGFGEHANSPKSEDKANFGPIPQGRYSISTAYSHKTKGPVVMRLTPVGHKAKGRSGFLIHGDNQKGNRSASQGCIILSHKTRDFVATKISEGLEVVANL